MNWYLVLFQACYFKLQLYILLICVRTDGILWHNLIHVADPT